VYDFIDPDVTFGLAHWAEVAAAIRIQNLPAPLKKEISSTLFDYELVKDEGTLAQSRQALMDLARVTNGFSAQLRELQCETILAEIVAELDTSIDQAEHLEKTAIQLLRALPKSKGGRPRQTARDNLVNDLLAIFTKYTRKPPTLSKNRDKQNPDRLRPGGHCYNFVTTVLRLRGIPTKGVEHVIQRAKHANNPS
jgi:hypothetical protein